MKNCGELDMVAIEIVNLLAIKKISVCETRYVLAQADKIMTETTIVDAISERCMYI